MLRPQRGLSRDDWADLIHQFREEATALTRLRHAHVAAVLDSGIAPLDDDPLGLAWMALEWLDGETLRDHLEARRTGGGRSPAACMALLRPVLETIAEAHELGIAHRDLKPSNIMIVPTKAGPVPHVLDFGIAKLMERGQDEAEASDTATDSRAPAFTAASAAPEQLAGTRTGPGPTSTRSASCSPRCSPTARRSRRRTRTSATARLAEVRPTPRASVRFGPWEPVRARALP